MDVVRARNVTRDTIIAERVEIADTSETRKRGLLGRTGLEPGTGLWLVPCEWVHMFGMKFPIDVAFLARDGKVLHVHHALKPGTISKLIWRADGALELPAGTLAGSGTVIGDRVELED